MSVRDHFGSAADGQVGQVAVSFAYTLGMLALSMAGVGLLAMLYVVWIEILHTSGAIEQTTPMAMRAFEAMFEIPVFAAIGAAITRFTNALADSDYSLTTAAGVAAGGYTVVIGIHLVLMRIGVVG